MQLEQYQGTKREILDAAERLFAAHGFKATSLRAITSEAGANLGAVNYHFTSKDELILAVLKRRIEPLNKKRMAMLNAYQAASGGVPPKVEQVLDALFRPAIELTKEPCSGGVTCLKLMSKLLAEEARTYLKPLIEEEFGESKWRFHAALRQAMPELSEEEAYWKLHFAMGVLVHTLCHSELLEIFSQGRCRLTGIDETLKRIIAFCAAGFAAGRASNHEFLKN